MKKLVGINDLKRLVDKIVKEDTKKRGKEDVFGDVEPNEKGLSGFSRVKLDKSYSKKNETMGPTLEKQFEESPEGAVKGLPGSVSSDVFVHKPSRDEGSENIHRVQGSNPGFGPWTMGERKVLDALGEYLAEETAKDVSKNVVKEEYWDAAARMMMNKKER